MSDSPKRVIVPVISTTHYDREWRFSLQQTRAMLLDLMDHLLEILDTQPDFCCYHLDSQSVILEDYLSLRPERESDLRRLITERKLFAGPWYSLPDMNLVAGECIIRNLLMGHRVAGSFGHVPKVGYTPTGFGHISQLPQIYNGFGIDTAMFYRGPDRSKVEKEFIWQAPDGSEAIAYIFAPEFGRMPLYHCLTRRVLYGQAFYEREHGWDAGEGPFRLHDDRTRWNLYYQSETHERFDTSMIATETRRMIDTELKGSNLDTFLCIDGTDSTEPQPRTPRLLAAMNAVCDTHEFVHTDLYAFAEVLRKARPKLKTFRGEMHTSAKDGVQVNLFGDTISTRTDLKQLNASTENKLIGWAEPFATWAWTEGEEYPSAMLDDAWRYLLNNQSHDCIAGCGQDIVHEDMVYYFRQASEIADEITRQSLFALTRRIDTEGLGENEILLFVFNPSARPRTEVVSSRVDLPAAWNAEGLAVKTLSGEECLFEVVGPKRSAKYLIHRPKDAPGMYSMDSWDIRFEAKEVPAMGWRAYRVEASTGIPHFDLRKPVIPSPVIENDLIRLEMESDGSFVFTDKATGRILKGLHQFEDRGEIGDAYVSTPPKEDRVIRQPTRVTTLSVEPGLVASFIRVEYQFALPISTEPEGRSSHTQTVTITTTALITRNSNLVRFTTEFENSVRDHRLRVLFPSSIHAAMSLSDMPFDFPSRPIKRPETTGWFERDHPNHPMRHFCAVMEEETGLAVMARGLSEYEVYDDSDRKMAITLIRGSRVKTPKVKVVDPVQKGSQQLGPQCFEYAVLPFEGADDLLEVHRKALDYCLPMRVGQSGRQKGQLPVDMSFLSAPLPFEVCAVKRSESEKGVVVRLWNPADTEQEGELVLGVEIAEAWLTNLAEERQEKLPVQRSHAIPLRGRPKQILTLELVVA